MNVGQFQDVLMFFNSNWAKNSPPLELIFRDGKVVNLAGHLIEGELQALLRGEDASLPYFLNDKKREVKWRTLAPSADYLTRAIADIKAWVIPSYGWPDAERPVINSGNVDGAQGLAMLKASPGGYYRWSCSQASFDKVREKLAERRRLLQKRPRIASFIRPSKFELRSTFATQLLTGDRDGAERTIADIERYRLDDAVNVECLKIRLWHHFHEYQTIVSYHKLSRLKGQPLPRKVQEWIALAEQEAAAGTTPKTAPRPSLKPVPTPPEVKEPEPESAAITPVATWPEWFASVLVADSKPGELFLETRNRQDPASLKPADVLVHQKALDEIYLRLDELGDRRLFLANGLTEYIAEFIKEPGFPRGEFGGLYSALLRIWGALYKGQSGSYLGNVLLELAYASLRLDNARADVLLVIKEWWKARPAPDQIPFLVDAIELIVSAHTDRGAASELWFEAAKACFKDPERVSPSDLDLLRNAGHRIKVGKATLDEYFPEVKKSERRDILEGCGLRTISIVTMREAQAKDAAGTISARAGAKVSIVTSKTAGKETDAAQKSDVVLFVYMATSHAAFRAFDRFDRGRLQYVQGTGVASIVRALERWVADKSESRV